MNYERMTENAKRVFDYLKRREEILFDQIHTVQHELESAAGTINEQEKYMEIEVQREEQEKNIFSLYTTSDQYSEAKAQLSRRIQDEVEKKAGLEQRLSQLEEEFAEIRDMLICDEIVVQYFSEESQKEEQAPIQDNNKAYEQDLVSRLKFCTSILELDKERCMQELKQLIQELQERE